MPHLQVGFALRRRRSLLRRQELVLGGGRGHGYVLTLDQSDTGSMGILSRWTNQTQEAWGRGRVSDFGLGQVKTPEGLNTDYRPRIKVCIGHDQRKTP
eukprot:1190281-Prorocentrum_minimum.AAC.2